MSFLARSFVRRAALAARPMVARRGFAEAVPADKLRLSLALPYETLYKNSDVVQVNIPSTAGDLGILADHVPTIQQLRPGLVEVIESTGFSKQFFVSGGFATVSEGSNLAINVVEAYAPEDFSPEAVKSLLAEAQKNAASSDPVVAAEAGIELEVLESLAHIAK
ncbi:similar to Saccharomyces cerevisiae YDL004W ATP16 Delta subunit of the central stalk of mitochondrial F1F0 ATP synthase [Geotrichum candidum]|uniref:ATP synthase subunit delta, mitochondrial n=1 Tax=Geotrichum candidum TaxID=1173061 RepID=A0A0J9XJP2_GEOCN|nr:similar to Saccharomyces cerevisiae YDL004W ATP16 Delta subunit of the central stalk of mitochondrial F1F0 ATP synthase [Geotrichum candidum]